MRHVKSGQILIDSQNLTNQKVRKITEAGVAHIPADRQKYGLILHMSLADNLALQTYNQRPISNHGISKHQTILKHAVDLIKKVDIRATSPALPASDLAGGN